jgi:ketosteroid isomerase-like protein
VSVKENMALAHRFLAARVKGDLDAMDDMMAPDYVSHTSLLSVQEPDRAGLKRVVTQFSAAFSNASVYFEDQVAAGERGLDSEALGVDWTGGGYSAEELGGLPEVAGAASLGCGNPTALATLSPGEVVLDSAAAAASTWCPRPGGSPQGARPTAWT